MHYYRKYKGEGGQEEMIRADFRRALESTYYAGVVEDMEADAEKGLAPYRQTCFTIYTVKA